jgi:hypothetical protein
MAKEKFVADGEPVEPAEDDGTFETSGTPGDEGPLPEDLVDDSVDVPEGAQEAADATTSKPDGQVTLVSPAGTKVVVPDADGVQDYGVQQPSVLEADADPPASLGTVESILQENEGDAQAAFDALIASGVPRSHLNVVTAPDGSLLRVERA